MKSLQIPTCSHPAKLMHEMPAPVLSLHIEEQHKVKGDITQAGNKYTLNIITGPKENSQLSVLRQSASGGKH